MQVYDFSNPGQVIQVHGPTRSYSNLPEDSIILANTPLISPGTNWQRMNQDLQKLTDQRITAKYVFIDGSYDPIHYSDREIQEQIHNVADHFPQSKIVFLSSRVQHWYTNISNIIYVPYFIGLHYTKHNVRPRKGRMGCLNRNNSPHKIWLMHNLFKNKLIDPERDVYSVSFVNPWNMETVSDVATWLGTSKTPYDLMHELKQYPKQIATHPDGFPNDYSTDHPAWNTGIAIVPETEPGYKTMLTEKTWKAIRSSSCWTAYMGDEAYKFLEDIGFEPRFFTKHASFDSIKPILNICRTIDTEEAALDYYHSKIHQIKHNFAWSGGDNEDSFTNWSAPWHRQFIPEFNRRLNSL